MHLTHPYMAALQSTLNLLENQPGAAIKALLQTQITKEITAHLTDQTAQQFIEWAENQIKTPTFIHKDGKHPLDTIVVDFENQTFYPLGGGFLRPLPANFESEFRRLLPSDQPNIEKHTYTLDDTPNYVGYSLGYLWNGWECPSFEKEVAIKILADNGFTGIYDSETDTFTITHPDAEDNETVKGYPIEYGGQIKTVYGIGSHSWTWFLADEDNPQVPSTKN